MGGRGGGGGGGGPGFSLSIPTGTGLQMENIYHNGVLVGHVNYEIVRSPTLGTYVRLHDIVKTGTAPGMVDAVFPQLLAAWKKAGATRVTGEATDAVFTKVWEKRGFVKEGKASNGMNAIRLSL